MLFKNLMQTNKIIFHFSFFLIVSSMSYCAHPSAALENEPWLQTYRVLVQQPIPSPVPIIIDRNGTYLVTGNVLDDLAYQKWAAEQRALAFEQRIIEAEQKASAAEQRASTAQYLRLAAEHRASRTQGQVLATERTLQSDREFAMGLELRLRTQRQEIINLLNTITTLSRSKSELEREIAELRGNVITDHRNMSLTENEITQTSSEQL